MTFPILPAHEAGLVLAVLIGFAFGFVLERAGFGRATKLAAQFYGHDMTVFKVMFGAIVTAMLGLVVASAAGLADFAAIADRAASGTFLVPMIGGGLLLGAGFILSGYCPGTSFVAAASGKVDGLVTVLGVVVGQVAWAELEGLPGLARFHGAGSLGNVYLWELLHLPSSVGPAVVAVAVTAMAVGCFVGVERLEKALASRADAAATPIAAGRAGRWVFAGFATAAAFGVVGLALPSGTRAGARAAAPIEASALARRVFDEPWRLRIVDTRPRAACVEARVPGSECVPASELPSLDLAGASGGLDLVVVADDGAAPAAALAYPGRVLVLRGGWRSWAEYALAPGSAPPDASAEDVEAHRLRAGIRSALTGVKTAPPPAAPANAPAPPRVKSAGGGGCGG
jgi:hypothetical protein